MARRWTVPALLVTACGWLALAACSPRSTSRPPYDVALEEQLKRLDAALDRVEERLLASQASVSLWDELRDRHEKVSALTCSNLSAHAQAMEKFMDVQRGKRLATAKNRLASRPVRPAALYR